MQQRWPRPPPPGYDGDMRESDVSGVQEWLLRAPHVDDGGMSFMQDLVAELRQRDRQRRRGARMMRA
jgi:hypothetical protein